MADKLTQQLTDALAKAAAHSAGLPLYAGKSEPGLFPNTAAAKPAAQKCLGDGLIRLVTTDPKAKATRDRYTLTDAGWDFLLAQVNPKQVLEDFVRVLEARQGEVGELLDTARRMAESLQGLKEAVARVLPAVSATRISAPVSRGPQASEGSFGACLSGSRLPSEHLQLDPVPTAIAVLDPHPEPDFEPAIRARLADWSGPTDCPLPELFRSLALHDSPPTIGQFHDCLRKMRAEGTLSLHSWTGPLYTMPEPAFALLVGHDVAYYASLKVSH